MSETQAIVRTKKRSVDRWMPGERMRKAQETALRAVNIAGQVLPGFFLSFADVMGIPSGLQAAWMAALAVMGESLLWPAGGWVLALGMRLVWGLPLRLELLLTLGVMLLAPLVIFRRGAWAMMGWTALSLLPTAVLGIFTGKIPAIDQMYSQFSGVCSCHKRSLMRGRYRRRSRSRW